MFGTVSPMLEGHSAYSLEFSKSSVWAVTFLWAVSNWAQAQGDVTGHTCPAGMRSGCRSPVMEPETVDTSMGAGTLAWFSAWRMYLLLKGGLTLPISLLCSHNPSLHHPTQCASPLQAVTIIKTANSYSSLQVCRVPAFSQELFLLGWVLLFPSYRSETEAQRWAICEVTQLEATQIQLCLLTKVVLTTSLLVSLHIPCV